MQIYYVSTSNSKVASASNDGTVTINGPGSVVLTIGFHDPAWQYMTREFLSFTVPEPASPEDDAVLLGDVDGNGKVNAADATEILKEYSRSSTGSSGTFDERQKKAGDIDKNGKIEAGDATSTLKYYSYLSTGGTATFEEFLS